MPGSRSAPSLELKFDAAEVRDLIADLRQLEGGKEIISALRRNLRAAAAPIKAQVQANASWSTRIPAAVAIGTAFGAKRTAGIFIRVNAKKAPHARPLENGGRAGTFRHPVFGNPQVWVSQPARPFFFGQAAQNIPQVERAAAEAVDEAARSAGFR